VKLFVPIFFAQDTQLGRLANETGDTLNHPSNSAAGHSALHAFAEVIMFSNLLLSSSHIVQWFSFYSNLCRGSGRVVVI
jgi:hypothetical protein